MKKTLTLPESEIITLADAAKKHGTVELAKMIGVGKSQLYRILRGHNRVTPETAEKIDAWLSTGIPQPEKRPASPTSPTSPTKSELLAALRNPVFLEIAVIELCKAIRDGRLRNVTIVLGGYCKCGD